ncbi:MAG: LysM peptidoglycan-binding domain-containing protein [Candidatus Curtissbacteria bacterium]
MAKTSTSRRSKKKGFSTKKQSFSLNRAFSKRFKSYDLSQSWTGLLLGAIIVIVLGFLVANFLTRGANPVGQIAGGEKTTAADQASASAEIKREYKIVEGDSLSAIAQKAYGREDLWVVLAAKNNIANPDLINVDTNLEVPAKEVAEAAFVELTQYNVQEGDTLFTISEKVYGDGSRWTELARANDVGYLANGNPLIFAGSTITIPRQ